MQRNSDVKLPFRALYEHPTPRALARYLSASARGSPNGLTCRSSCSVPNGGLLMREMIDFHNALRVDFWVLLVEYPDWRREWDVICDVDRYLDFIVAQIRAAAPATPAQSCRLFVRGERRLCDIHHSRGPRIHDRAAQYNRWPFARNAGAGIQSRFERVGNSRCA